MTVPESDPRSPGRRVRDEVIAAEPPLEAFVAARRLDGHVGDLPRTGAVPIGCSGSGGKRLGPSPGSRSPTAGTCESYHRGDGGALTLRDAAVLEEARRGAEALVTFDPPLVQPDHARLRRMTVARYDPVLELVMVG